MEKYKRENVLVICCSPVVSNANLKDNILCIACLEKILMTDANAIFETFYVINWKVCGKGTHLTERE